MLTEFHWFFITLLFYFHTEIEKMSPAATKTKKRKANEIDTSQPRDEQSAKAKKLDSGERKCIYDEQKNAAFHSRERKE